MMVQKLREDSPDLPSTISENKNTREVVLDFVAWPKDKSFEEFNVWKLGASCRAAALWPTNMLGARLHISGRLCEEFEIGTRAIGSSHEKTACTWNKPIEAPCGLP